MATVLEECTTEEQFSVVRFMWAKGLDAKGEWFPIYCEKCLSRKAVHNWVPNVSLMMKRLKRRCGSAGFDTLLKRWDKFINIGGGRIC
jgi:hypothetical protein